MHSVNNCLNTTGSLLGAFIYMICNVPFLGGTSSRMGAEKGRLRSQGPGRDDTGADLPGGDRQAGPVPADQHTEALDVRPAVRRARQLGPIQYAAPLRLRGPRAQVLEEYHVRRADLRRRRIRQPYGFHCQCKLTLV